MPAIPLLRFAAPQFGLALTASIKCVENEQETSKAALLKAFFLLNNPVIRDWIDLAETYPLLMSL